jgi:hypothetical protein
MSPPLSVFLSPRRLFIFMPLLGEEKLIRSGTKSQNVKFV